MKKWASGVVTGFVLAVLGLKYQEHQEHHDTGTPSKEGLQIRIESRGPVFKKGAPMLMRFTVDNPTAAEITVPALTDYTDGLAIKEREGKEVKAAKPSGDKPGSAPRVLKPGEFFGKVIDVSALLDKVEQDGFYGFQWSYAGAASSEIGVYVTKDYRGYCAKVETNYGDMVIEFYPDSAPIHVSNFITLANKGFYNGLTFHRIIKGFMMQGGCPKGDGSGGPGYAIPAEFNERHHVAGTLSMARTPDPNSAGSQFFICFKTLPQLDRQYTVFGQVVEGVDVVQKIEREVKTDHKDGEQCGVQHKDKPLEPVVMKKITIFEKEKEPQKEKK